MHRCMKTKWKNELVTQQEIAEFPSTHTSSELSVQEKYIVTQSAHESSGSSQVVHKDLW